MTDQTSSIRLDGLNTGDNSKPSFTKSTSALITTHPIPRKPTLPSGASLLVHLSKLLILTTTAYFITLLSLAILSSQHDGILTIRQWSYIRPSSDPFSGLSLLWTSLPTLIFSLLGFLMGFVFKDVIELTPFLALHRGPVRGDRCAVLVDYRTESRVLLIPRALRRGHWLVAVLTIVMLVWAAAVVPLSAHLFETRLKRVAEVQGEGARMVAGLVTAKLGPEADYGRAMEIASAREVYGGGGGEFARWMDGSWVFPVFTAAGRAWVENSTVTIQGVRGYGAELEGCGFVGGERYRVSEAGRGNSTGNGTMTGGGRVVSVSGADGGCLIKMDLEVEDGKYDLYFGSGVYQCPEGQNNSTLPPVFFFMAWPVTTPGVNSSSLALSTRMLSCQPSYKTAVGSLSISTANSELIINGFSNISSTDIWSPQAGFEKALLTTKSTSASAAGSRARVQTTAFGNLVLARFDITKRNPAKPWSENDVDTEKDLQAGLIESAQVIFKSVILSSLSSMARDESKWPLGVKENLRTVTTDIDVERLFVFLPVAVFIMVALFVVILLAFTASTVSREMRDRNVSVPANIVAYHGILHGCSDLHQVAAGVHDPDPDGDFSEAAKKQWNLKSALFHVEVDGARRRLHAQGLRWRGS